MLERKKYWLPLSKQSCKLGNCLRVSQQSTKSKICLVVLVIALCMAFLPVPYRVGYAVPDNVASVASVDSTSSSQIPPSNCRIHVLAFSYADAILIECDGQFGLIDAGEDRDSPLRLDSPSDLYPIRDGISEGKSTGKALSEYLDSVGVTEDNLLFVIGTHAHSDHLGGMDTIIKKYKPTYIFTPYYSDDYICSTEHLWDNQYVYDQMIEAAMQAQQEYGAVLIQDISTDESLSEFSLGSASIKIFDNRGNFENYPAYDANDLSWTVEVTMNGHKAFLAADLTNFDGDEDEMAAYLSDIEFIKLGHHGNVGSNTSSFLNAIMKDVSTKPNGTPNYAVQTGYSYVIWDETAEALKQTNTRLYSTTDLMDEGVRAVVADFYAPGIVMSLA